MTSKSLFVMILSCTSLIIINYVLCKQKNIERCSGGYDGSDSSDILEYSEAQWRHRGSLVRARSYHAVSTVLWSQVQEFCL